MAINSNKREFQMYQTIKSLISKLENSWYLKTSSVHHFICQCGQTDQYTDIVNLHHTCHHCSQCNNAHYIDSIMFLNNENIKAWSTLYWSYETHVNKSSWVVNAIVTIPVFNYALQKISMQKYTIATASINNSGTSYFMFDHSEITEKLVYNGFNTPLKLTQIIEKKIWGVLYNFVMSNPSYSIKWLSKDKLTNISIMEKIKILKFFLEYYHLRELDFFFWDSFELVSDKIIEHNTVPEILSYVFDYRNEKSVRKTYLNAYQKAIVGHYNPKADYIFARMIHDPNHLVKLIKMKPEIKNSLFDDLEVIDVYGFFDFLKENYTDRSIIKLWTSVSLTLLSKNIIRDTIKMYSHITSREHFIKQKANFESLHNEFIRLNNFEKSTIDSLIQLKGKINFDYSANELHAQVQKNHMSFILPMTVTELFEWANKLNNCMYGYTNSIHQGWSIIYGVFIDHDLKYAVEIESGRIVQALGDSNKSISNNDMRIIERWFKQVYLVS